MTVTAADGFGLAAFLLNVWGNLLLTSKSATGWYVRIIAIICWGAYGLAAASWPNLVNAVTFFCINCYGLWKWKRAKPTDVERLKSALRWYADGCPVPSRHRDDADPTGHAYDGGVRARRELEV